ncbi:sodium/nucleoside cotransporter [Plakobranchus ocellatus]|uniref:Sodium/nucleoside cotransporter n=1 Tax=Plakobranchus ocellatus TaxID=259542 RepID=A0AAV4DA34_9GAST|nr:sodium/nucleoside cotransporter [Plakobranchus ocellatus]
MVETKDGQNGDLLPSEHLFANPKPARSVDEIQEITIVVEKGGKDDADGEDINIYKDKHTNNDKATGGWAGYVDRLEETVRTCLTTHTQIFTSLTKGLALLLYFIYFIYCMNYRFGDGGSITLLVGTAFLVLVILCKLFPDRLCCFERISSLLTFSPRRRRVIRYGLYVASFLALITYVGLKVLARNPKNAQSLLGLFGIVLMCFLLSKKPSKINWHPVFWGFVIQFLFAAITLQTETGHDIFRWLGDMVQDLMEYSFIGGTFVLGKNFRRMGIALSYGSIMIFFGSLMGLLTHWGILQFIVVKGGRALSFILGTGPVESVVAFANIFVGMSQSALLVRPYFPTMSKSELGALITCGFASVSGDMVALLISFGAPANHLLTAAVISAPAALAISKILMPETEEMGSIAKASIVTEEASEKFQTILGAAADGALVAMRIVVNAMTNMLAFVSLLGLIDAILLWFGDRAGVQGLTFDLICGYVLFPLTFAMGVPYEDCSTVGSLIGIKLFATPVVGYAKLGKIINNRMILEDYVRSTNGTWHWEGSDVFLDDSNTTLVNGVLSEHAEVIATYAMCSFSAFPAIGIALGVMTSVCPVRRNDVMKLVGLAFFGGNVASFATGAVAGLTHISK